MKYLILIVLIFGTYLNIFAVNVEKIEKFDLTVKEFYGCFGINPYYRNFHFENDIFSITYCDYTGIKKQFFYENEFQIFIDSLYTFHFKELKNDYKLKTYNSASDRGLLEIYINDKKIKSIKYWTYPYYSENFMKLHKWLDIKSKNINSFMDLPTLLSINFSDNEYIEYFIVTKTISENLEYFKLENILNVLDTSNNINLNKILFFSLRFYKDESIIDIIGEKIINNINYVEDYTSRYETFMLYNSFLEQDSCMKKIEYLKKFIIGNNDLIKLSASLELLSIGIKDGIENIHKSIEQDELENNYREAYYKFVVLISHSDTSILKNFITNYERLKKTYTQNENTNIIFLKSYIIAINLILDKKKISKDEFINECNELIIIEEITKLDERLKNE